MLAIKSMSGEIVDSPEGRDGRTAMMDNVLSLRNQLREAGLDYYGAPLGFTTLIDSTTL